MNNSCSLYNLFVHNYKYMYLYGHFISDWVKLLKSICSIVMIWSILAANRSNCLYNLKQVVKHI